MSIFSSGEVCWNWSHRMKWRLIGRNNLGTKDDNIHAYIIECDWEYPQSIQ